MHSFFCNAFVSRAATPDLRFQFLHAVRLVNKAAETKALTPKGKLYNKPELPSSSESEEVFRNISFPVSDGMIDTGHLIRRAESEMIYLHLSESTRWQYMQAWWELYAFLYLSCSTVFIRESCITFVENTTQKHQECSLHEWKRKTDVNGLGELQPSQVQSMLVFLSERHCLNNRGTVFPIIWQIPPYLYAAEFIPTDLSGTVLTPTYKNTHLRPYITTSDEEKLFRAMEKTPLRTKAMLRLGLRLGLRDIDICCLRFNQIDWKNDQIILEQKKQV